MKESSRQNGGFSYRTSIFQATTNSFVPYRQNGVNPLLGAYYSGQGSCSITIPKTDYFMLIGGYNNLNGSASPKVELFQYKNGQIIRPPNFESVPSLETGQVSH